MECGDETQIRDAPVEILPICRDVAALENNIRLVRPLCGSQGDAYDNALAESVIGVYKTEVIRRKGPWRTLEAVEFATLTWVDWFNTRRLLGPLGDIPPAEFEAQYYEQAEVA